MKFFEKLAEAAWYKMMMPKLYGWGASLVILGALFKINHYEGADIMLLIGLSMEAIIPYISYICHPNPGEIPVK